MRNHAKVVVFLLSLMIGGCVKQPLKNPCMAISGDDEVGSPKRYKAFVGAASVKNTTLVARNGIKATCDADTTSYTGETQKVRYEVEYVEGSGGYIASNQGSDDFFARSASAKSDRDYQDAIGRRLAHPEQHKPDEGDKYEVKITPQR